MSLIIISIVIIILISILYLLSFYLSLSSRGLDKLSPYECGLEAIADARMKFAIIYYIIGILYLIFDLEIIFLFPLASILFSLNNLFALWFILFFLLILTIGFIYEWFKGALSLI